MPRKVWDPKESHSCEKQRESSGLWVGGLNKSGEYMHSRFIRHITI